MWHRSASRKHALLRRAGQAQPAEAPDITRLGSLEIDHQQRLATVGGAPLTVTPLEFKLLVAFARNPRQILSNDRIIDLVWGDDFTAADQVKLLVGRLRRKLGEGDGAPEIETVRGFGYRFNPAD